jgi:glycosyltransferase involved in cell wall biosynthesis
VSHAGQPARIAVVIPAFNGAEFVETAVRSALDQSLPPSEIVVVDDGSTDDTAARAHRIAEVHERVSVIAQANGGVSAARNAGVRHTTCELLAFLDCDDLWYADKLRQQAQFLESHPDCVVVGARLAYHGRKGRLRGFVGEATPDERQADIRAGRYLPMQLSSWLVRRCAFERAGGFDESLRGVGQVEDVDLLARLARLGEVRILPGGPQGAYRLHGDSASSASFFKSRAAVRFVRARIAARDEGRDVTFEEYRQTHPESPPSRADRAQFAFREAGVAIAQEHRVLAVARLAQAVWLDPRYTARRLWLRTSGGRR